MRFFPTILGMVLLSLPLWGGGGDGAVLDYRFTARLEDQAAPVAGGFRLVTTPALAVRSRVKRPRMGGWRIEPLAGDGAAPTPAVLMRALSVCYFSGPTDQTAPLPTGMTIGHRWCRLWQVQVPREVGAYAYLAEVAPGLLALAYFSAALPGGSVRSLEVHLAGVALGPRTVPAEEGTALLRTLQAWAFPPAPPAGGEPGALETESVP